jgi:hypothetical protein
MATIQQLDEKRFFLEVRGTKMTLEPFRSGWRMKTVSAATRVWSLGGESWKEFNTLAEVEAKYKSWRGIASLLNGAAHQVH